MIPHEYRKHFPIEMKDHNSHDVLLLCTSCHAISNYHDNHLKQQLAREFQAPIGSEEGLRLLEDPERRQVRSGARALLTAESLPAHRKEELLQALREFYHTHSVTEQMLQEAASLETRYGLHFYRGVRGPARRLSPNHSVRTLAGGGHWSSGAKALSRVNPIRSLWLKIPCGWDRTFSLLMHLPRETCPLSLTLSGHVLVSSHFHD